MRHAATTLLAALAASLAAADSRSAPFELSYAGHSIEANGDPTPGPLDVEVRLFRAATGGEPLVAPLTFAAVPVTEGHFAIDLPLGSSELQLVFNQTDPVWIEIAFPALGRTLPRQRYRAVPYALSVPVDGKTVAFDGGKLRAGPGTPAGANQFLTSDGNGALVWGTPASTFATITTGSGGVSLGDNDGTPNTTVLRSAANVTSNVTYTFPPSAVAGQYLKTDGAGTLSWGSPSGSGDMTKDVYDTNTDNMIDLAKGGTGASTAAGARAALELGSAAQLTAGTSAGNLVPLDGSGKIPNAQLPVPGASGQLVMNSGGTFSADSSLGWDASKRRLKVAGQGLRTLIIGEGTSATTTGVDNTLVGYESGNNLSSGTRNTLLGSRTGTNLGTGSQNVFIGHGAGQNATTTGSVLVGTEVGADVTGGNNTALGRRAALALTSGTNNVFVGFNAGASSTSAASNVAIGYHAGITNVSGSSNVYLGDSAGSSATTSNGIYIGASAGANVSTGTANTIVGYQAVTSLTSGARNTVVGYETDADAATSDTVIVGHNSGSTADHATVLGANSTNTGANAVVLGSGITNSAANQIVLGDTTNYVAIGTTSGDASAKLTVNRPNDGTLVAFNVSDANEGAISVVGGAVTYGAFTGSHYALVEGKEPPVGALVTLTGRVVYRQSGSEPLYVVEIATRKNDPRILGAFLGRLDPAVPAGPENPHVVMALGNGEVRVSDAGGEVRAGDYLIAAPTAGDAQRDDGAAPVSYLVARAAEDARFASMPEPADGGPKRRRLSVLFENVPRSHAEAREIVALRERLARLEAALSEHGKIP